MSINWYLFDLIITFMKKANKLSKFKNIRFGEWKRQLFSSSNKYYLNFSQISLYIRIYIISLIKVDKKHPEHWHCVPLIRLISKAKKKGKLIVQINIGNVNLLVCSIANSKATIVTSFVRSEYILVLLTEEVEKSVSLFFSFW